MSKNHSFSNGLWLAIILVVIGESCLVVMGALIRSLGSEISVIQIVFLRNALSMALVVLGLLRMQGASLSSSQHGLLFLRGIIGVAAMFCLYFAFSKVALVEVSAIKAMTPLLIPIFAFFILSERINSYTVIALIVAFIASLLIIEPSSAQSVDGNLVAYFAAAVAVALAALVKVIVRKLGRTEPSPRIVFYFALYASLATAPFAYWYWQPMQLKHWGALCLIAVIATIGQLAITRAFAIANAGVIGLFGYSSIPFAAFLGWWLWSDALTTTDLLGILLLFCAGGLGFSTNKQRGYRKPESFNR